MVKVSQVTAKLLHLKIFSMVVLTLNFDLDLPRINVFYVVILNINAKFPEYWTCTLTFEKMGTANQQTSE